MKVERPDRTNMPWVVFNKFDNAKDSLWVGFNIETKDPYVEISIYGSVYDYLRITPKEFLKVVEEINEFSSIVKKSSLV